MQNILTGKRAGRVCSATGIFGQTVRVSLESAKPFMFLIFIRRVALCLVLGALIGVPAAGVAQTNYYAANGTEYAVAGSLFGDQVFPDVAVTPNGGFLVWQDNATDGDGWGVSAQRMDGTLSGTLSPFRVNVQGTNDQENPRVAMLKNGGAVFVWEGGKQSYQHIFARFLTPGNTWLTTTDVLVNAQSSNSTMVVNSYSTNTITTITTNYSRHKITGYATNTTIMVTTTTNTINRGASFQVNPAVAVLNNSNVVVVWSSFNEAGAFSQQDIYARILSPTGEPVGNQFLVNQFTNYNQRTPAVAALKGGGFVVAWVSEQQRIVAPAIGTNTTYSAAGAAIVPSVDIYTRLYQGSGTPAGNEFLASAGNNPCANPSVAAASDGGFMVAWSGRDMAVFNNAWDVYARPFSSTGAGGTMLRLNSNVPGNQYAPHLSAIGLDYLAVWTSLQQDGSRDGVYGQLVHNDGSPVGGEFRVNTTTVSQQMQPAVASDGAGQFIAVWAGYIGLPDTFDLFAQRYASVSSLLQPLSAPFVNAPFALSNGVYQPQLQVSWPPLLGISISSYEVYVDGSSTPTAVVTNNQWMMTAADGLTPNSTHSFAVDYVATDGRTSPISPATSGKTWGGLNWGGIPFEWMTQNYGSDISKWPAASGDSDGDGMSTSQEFLSGTVPTNSASVLRAQPVQSGQGMFLNWDTQAGFTYQVQVTTDMKTWSNLGAPRFAAGATDSIYVGGSSFGYYRVTLLRQ